MTVTAFTPVADRVLADAVRSSNLAMIITDSDMPDNGIVFANQAFLSMTGYGLDDIMGRNCRFLQGPGTDPETARRIGEAVRQNQSLTVDVLNYRKDGEPFWNALTLGPVADDAGRMRYQLAVLADTTQRLSREAMLQAAVTEAEQTIVTLRRSLELQQLMAKEIDHRVKNNLQMVSAMLTLQAISIPDQRVRQTLQEMLARVDALMMVHKRLYEMPQNGHFDLDDLVYELVTNVLGAAGRKDIRTNMHLDPMQIDPKAAASVALMMNEGLTNAVKHGFRDGRSGVLSVHLHEIDTYCVIDIADDGFGLVSGQVTASFGTTLVDTLAAEIGAEITRAPLDPGTLFRIRFPLKPRSKI